LQKFSIVVFLLISVTVDSSETKRIISLAPMITKNFCLLDTQDKIVGISLYCKEIKEVKDKEVVGTFVNMNLEKIVSLKPDIVLSSSIMDQKQVKKLKDLKINIVTFDVPKNFKQLCNFFLSIAKIVNKEKKGLQIIQEVEKNIKLIRKRIEKLPQPKVIIQIGANPLFVANKDYFINDLIEFAGGINIAKDAKTGLYSREQVIKQNPDVIIVVTMGLSGKEEKKQWEKFKTINAVKNNRIYIIDSYEVCSPTPVSFVSTLKEIVKILQ
jgi:iron complex transport system substrate-binding protein